MILFSYPSSIVITSDYCIFFLILVPILNMLTHFQCLVCTAYICIHSQTYCHAQSDSTAMMLQTLDLHELRKDPKHFFDVFVLSEKLLLVCPMMFHLQNHSMAQSAVPFMLVM